ncbi:hypothetical protein KAX22_09725, partial [bacterium]|nr:hypothetical protein [bacterium]
DGQNLKDRLVQLIHDPELREEKGREGRKWVERRHDIKVVIKELYGYYRRLGWLEERAGEKSIP